MHAARPQAADHPPPPPPRGLDAGIGRLVVDRVAWFRMWLYCLTALSDGVLSHATAVRGATMKELKVTQGLMLANSPLTSCNRVRLLVWPSCLGWF